MAGSDEEWIETTIVLRGPLRTTEGAVTHNGLSGEIDGPVCSVSDRGGLRLSRADSGAQVLPLARMTVPPSLPA
jgi:hypothetical protein